MVGYGICCGVGGAKHNQEKAVVLSNGKVNEEVFMDIRASEEHPHLRPQAKAPVVVLLGSITTRFWEFANVFAKSLSAYVADSSLQ